MKEQNEIDIRIWDYLDNNDSAGEHEHTRQLISQGGIWQERYEELAAMHRNIPAMLELEEPPVRFTKNVMDAIAGTQIARPARKYINQRIIKGIAASFIICICGMLAYILLHTQWQNGNGTSLAFPVKQLKQYDTTVVNTIVIVNIILFLVLVDTLLRSRRNQQLQNGREPL